MSPDDRKKLQDAFNEAVKASPFADEVIIGMYTKDDRPMTRRMLVEGTLKLDAFYEEVDAAVAAGETTIDRFIAEFRVGMKKSIYGDPSP